jgi:hypothetical protein
MVVVVGAVETEILIQGRRGRGPRLPLSRACVSAVSPRLSHPHCSR